MGQLIEFGFVMEMTYFIWATLHTLVSQWLCLNLSYLQFLVNIVL